MHRRFFSTFASIMDVPTEREMKAVRMHISRPHPSKEAALKVCVFGPANVGKSLLVNRLTESLQSPTSPVPGTTIWPLEISQTVEDSQLVFVDTPPLHSFNLDVIRSCADSCDLLLPVVDINDNGNASMLESVLKKSQKPSLLVLNKSENVLKIDTERHVEKWREVMGDSVGQIMTTSALERFGTAKLQAIKNVNSWTFSANQKTVRSPLQSVYLTVREKILREYGPSIQIPNIKDQSQEPSAYFSQLTTGWDNHTKFGTIRIAQNIFVADESFCKDLADPNSSKNRRLDLEIRWDLMSLFKQNVSLILIPTLDKHRANLDLKKREK